MKNATSTNLKEKLAKSSKNISLKTGNELKTLDFYFLRNEFASPTQSSGQIEGSFQKLGIEYLPHAMFFPSEA